MPIDYLLGGRIADGDGDGGGGGGGRGELTRTVPLLVYAFIEGFSCREMREKKTTLIKSFKDLTSITELSRNESDEGVGN